MSKRAEWFHWVQYSVLYSLLAVGGLRDNTSVVLVAGVLIIADAIRELKKSDGAE